VTSILVGAIRSYRRFVSPFLPPSCRYLPSCSQYAEEALLEHGPVKGFALAIARILRRHPWAGHGHDPVPRKTP
jgi:putative membrane protein insertion efficiency factor